MDEHKPRDGQLEDEAETDLENLLEELSGLGETPPADELPSEETLLAYHRGELDEAAVEAVERRLVADGAARERLGRVAGSPLPSPSPFLRARVLRAYRRRGSPGLPASGRPASGRPASRRWLPVAVAALLVLSLGGLLLRGLLGPGELPPGLTYDISSRGLADVRSGDAETEIGAELVARPETPVELVVTPSGVAEADVDFALYGLDGEGWRRLEEGIELEVTRGVGIFRAAAGDLAPSPGLHDLLVVAARPGDLPARLDAESVSMSVSGSAEEGARRRVYRQRLLLLPAAPPR